MTEPTDKFKVFLSYSRDDIEFADQLMLALNDRGFDPLLDRHEIDSAEEWKKRLGELIFRCDTVVFVLTVNSAASHICAWEVEHAERLGKRMIPIVPEKLDGLEVPFRLAELNYIFFYSDPKIPGSGVFDGLIRLDRALRVDLDWLREATRLAEAAAAWIASDQSEDRLLRGHVLEESQSWRSKTPTDVSVQPNTQEYLNASADVELRRQAEAAAQLAERQRFLTDREAAVAAEQAAVKQKSKVERALRDAEIAASKDRENSTRRIAARTRVGALAALTLALVAGIASVYAFFQAREATAQKQVAVRERNRAEDALARLLVERSWNEPFGERELSMKYALAANQLSDGNELLVRASLARSVNEGLLPTNVLTASAQVILFAENHDGSAGIVLTDDQSAELWKYPADERIWQRMTIFKDVAAASFSPDESMVMIVGFDATIRLIDPVTLTNLVEFKGHESAISSAQISPDGRRLITASLDHTAILWDVGSGRMIAKLLHDAAVTLAIYSQDGTRLLTASEDGTARLWDSATGEPLGPPLLHDAAVTLAIYSQDGTRLLTASEDGTARLWDSATGEPLGPPLLHEAAVTVATFSMGGMQLLTVDREGNFYLWDYRNFDLLRVFLGKQNSIDHGRFSDDGSHLVGVDQSGLIIVWEIETGRVILESNTGDYGHTLLSVTNNTATISFSDGSIQLLDYSASLKSLEELRAEACLHLNSAKNMRFSPLEVAADSLITDTWIASASERSICEPK